VAIVGQNGCGKSTLAKTIMGITPFRNGKILFKQADLIDKNFSAHQVYDRGIAYLMQESNVFNTLTISENLRFAARELDKKQYETKLAQLKELFDLFKNNRRWQMKASFLSGGEKRQLAIAQALMHNPELLILDEPSAGLSPYNRRKMFDVIKKINTEEKISILLIEQNVTEAVKIADRIGLLRLGKMQKLEDTKTIKKIDQFFWN
jgi:branched-chain amino acid transport system ATP-binding protein